MKRCNKVLLLIVVLMISCAAILCANAATTLSISSPDNYDLFSWNRKITIKWNSITGAAGYHVSVRKDGATDPCLYREWVTGTSYDISDSIPADPGKYKVWVGAVETQGAASPVDWQDSIEIYIAREPAVTNGDASAINDSGATLEMSVDRDYGYAIEDCGFYIGTSSTKSQMTKYSFKNYSTAQGATSKGTKYMEVTGLEAGKKYYYRAYAVNTVGEDYSESSYFFTTGGTPVTLSKPVITYPTNNSICQANKSIKLQWNAVSGVEKYYYYIKQLSGTPDTSNNNEPCVEEWTGSVSSSRKYYTLSATNVKAGYWYKFVVEASAEGAISGWSDWCYVYIGKGTLTKPVVTSLTNWSEVNPGNAILVDWDDVDTAAGYRCHIKRLSGQPDTSDNNEPALQSWKPDCGTTSSYTLAASDVTGGYWYKFVVEAFDGGESTWSDWYYLYATETGKLDIPVITSPVVGDNCEAGKSIAFTWGKVANAEGYNYFIKELTGEPDYSDNESASKSWKGSTSATRRRFTLNGEYVQPNTWYKFVVEAKAEGYQSGWSRYTYIKIPDRVDWVHYKLPPALLEIQDEMFSGNSELRTFDASDSNLMRIGSNAFAGCKNLLSINLPATVEYIADDAFTNCSSVVFHCVSGSYAESYAKEKGIQVEQHGIAVESDMIQVSQTRWDPEGDAAQLNLDVTSSGNWKATKSSNSSWLTLSATSGYSSDRITLKASKNTKSSKRTATITFTCGDATAKVEIEQKKAGSSGGSSGSTATPVVTGNWKDSQTIQVTLGDTHYLEGDINVSNGYLEGVYVYGGANQTVAKEFKGTEKTHIDDLRKELWIDTKNNDNYNKAGTYELTLYAKAEGTNEAVKIGSKTLVVKSVETETPIVSFTMLSTSVNNSGNGKIYLYVTTAYADHFYVEVLKNNTPIDIYDPYVNTTKKREYNADDFAVDTLYTTRKKTWPEVAITIPQGTVVGEYTVKITAINDQYSGETIPVSQCIAVKEKNKVYDATESVSYAVTHVRTNAIYDSRYGMTDPPGEDVSGSEYYKGLVEPEKQCAEYVADCLKNGGLAVLNEASIYVPERNDFRNPYINSLGMYYWFKTKTDYRIINSPKYADYSIGDIAFESDLGHVVIITGFTVNGKPLFSAHNNPRLNRPIYSDIKYLVKLSE